MAAGATLTVVDADGTRYQATVTQVTDRAVRVGIGSRLPPGTVGAPGSGRLTLIQALPQGALMDRIIRQATELGVADIVPVIAVRTQGRPPTATLVRKRSRWQRIARQAVQQSGAAPPSIGMPLALPRYLEQRTAPALELLLHPGAAPLHEIREWNPHAVPDLEVRCAVGPEGGFSASECELFRDCGFHRVGLQAGVLRVDTAAISALAAVSELLAATSPRSTNATST